MKARKIRKFISSFFCFFVNSPQSKPVFLHVICKKGEQNFNRMVSVFYQGFNFTSPPKKKKIQSLRLKYRRVEEREKTDKKSQGFHKLISATCRMRIFSPNKIKQFRDDHLCQFDSKRKNPNPRSAFPLYPEFVSFYINYERTEKRDNKGEANHLENLNLLGKQRVLAV